MLIQITNAWQSLNALSGQPVGTAMIVQSQSSSRVYVKQQPTQPAQGSFDAVILKFGELWQSTISSEETWVKVDSVAGQLFVEVL